MKAPRYVQEILFKAYPDYAAKLASDYINSIKKIDNPIKSVVDKINPKSIPDLRPRITGKETPKVSGSKPNSKITGTTPKQIGTYNQSTPNKNLDSAFDTLYGKGKQEVPKAKVNTPKAKVGKGIKIGKGGGVLAAAQGLINMNDPNATTTDKVRGATMFGTGMLGLASASPWLLGTAGALAIGDALAEPIGNAIGGAIARKKYGKEEEWFNPETGILDITTDLKGNRLSPEDVAKIQAYNDKRYQEIAKQYGQAMVPFGATSEQAPVSEQSGEIPNSYSNQIPSSPVTQSGIGFVPQNVQNAQQGGLNNYQDMLQPKPIQPVLNSIVEPVNYSNEYLMKANSLSQSLQPQPQGQEQMINNDPYNIGDIRGYADVINNQMAPIPNQPQNIREDVLPEYLQVMKNIRGKQGELNYGDILNQYNEAAKADARRNALNQMVNTFGAFGTPSNKAPISYVSAKGDLNKIELDQPNKVQPLPTNTSSNVDALAGQLDIKQAQYKDMLAQQKAQQDLIKAQLEREDTVQQAIALAERFGGNPYMYMNKDIVNAFLKEIVNPNIQAQANITEAIGKAPTQDTLKAAEQYRDIAGKLDEAQAKGQWDTVVANINNQATLIKTQLEQNNMNEREAAALANQWAIAQLGQYQQNYRALMEDTTKRDLAVYGRGTQKEVANIYAKSREGSNKQPQTLEELKNQVFLEGVKSGTAIPQLLKYMEALESLNGGLTSAEERELQ